MAEEKIVKLIYVTDDEPGYRRKKWGRGHQYFDPAGSRISRDELKDRLKTLVIPPMWENVWICKRKNGHLQVTGYDEKGRKQYLYHPLWQEYRSRHKFDKMIEFGHALPRIREQVAKDLRRKGWPKEKILALVVSILDETHVRIGNREYLKENNTYGLTTLRRKHLVLEDGEATFTYKAKHGIEQKVTIDNKKLVKLIKECSELPGYELFRYQEGALAGQAVDSGDVNEYLKEISGEDFSSKNFRTWGGTVTTVERLEDAIEDITENPKRELTPTLVKKVAERLGNTEAVCREYYIHPCVLDSVDSGYLLQSLRRFKTTDQGPYGLRPLEQVTLKVLEKQQKEHEVTIEIVDKKNLSGSTVIKNNIKAEAHKKSA
ncbi:DNA topoisomerase [Flammeovirgaceae bacterium 311]|nr:DNA topoisomerase [Flammeovirgaceae bacterium 311]